MAALPPQSEGPFRSVKFDMGPASRKRAMEIRIAVMENRSDMSLTAGTKLLAVREASIALANAIKDIGADFNLDADPGRIIAALDALEHVDSAVVQALVIPNAA